MLVKFASQSPVNEKEMFSLRLTVQKKWNLMITQTERQWKKDIVRPQMLEMRQF